MTGEEGDKHEAEATPASGGASKINNPGSKAISVAAAVISFLLSTGVITAGLQFAQSQYESASNGLKEDASKLLEVENKLIDIVETRRLTSYRLVEKLKAKAADFAAEQRDFEAMEEKWNEQEPHLRGMLEYYVDAPTGKNTSNKRKFIQDKDTQCLDFPFPDDLPLDPTSASDVLQVSAHCEYLVSEHLQRVLDSRRGGPAASLDFKDDETRLSHVWWINDVLRCIVVQRAILVHNSSPGWFGGVNAPTPPGERNCLADYCLEQKRCEAPQEQTASASADGKKSATTSRRRTRR